MRRAAWLHTSAWLLGFSPVGDTILGAMDEARSAGVPISLDLNLRLASGSFDGPFHEAVRRAVEAAAYVFGSSEGELALTAGIDDPVEAAEALAAGRRTVVARFGAGGAAVVDESGKVTQVAAFETESIDTVGAGDVHSAGFVLAVMEGKPVTEAARWGNALAALSVSREGASGHLTRADLDALLAS